MRDTRTIARKARGDLKRMGCPYWPDPTDPRAIAWLEGYRERNNELGALLTEQAQS
jgi:hypothetical protein